MDPGEPLTWRYLKYLNFERRPLPKVGASKIFPNYKQLVTRSQVYGSSSGPLMSLVDLGVGAKTMAYLLPRRTCPVVDSIRSVSGPQILFRPPIRLV